MVHLNQVIALLDRRLQPYRISGAEARTRTCPFCGGGDSNDLYTFCVSLETGAYKCFRGSCGVSGDFKRLAERMGERVDANPRSALKTNPQYVPPTSKCYALTDDIISYFDRRGISEATLNAYGVSADEKGNILFPFTMDGELVFVKHRKLKRLKNDPKEWADKNTRPIIFGMDLCDPSLPLTITEGECFPKGTELLTERGWVKFEDYDGTYNVCQVDSNLKASFVKPDAIIKKHYEGNLLAARIGGNYTSITTPMHNIVLREAKKKAIFKQMAKDVRNTTAYQIPTTINLDGSGIPLCNDQIALYLAVSADCTIDVRKSGIRHSRFGVKKERKYLRMKSLLDNLGIDYVDTGYNKRTQYYYIGFRTPDYIQSKLLPDKWIYQATLEQRRFIISEMVYWDGNHVNGRQQVEYSTKEYHNASLMQTIAHTAGYMSTVMTRDTVLNGKHFTRFKVSVLLGKDSVSAQRWVPESIAYADMVYCVSVPTGMIVVRQEGHIAVTGNCDALSLYEAGIPNAVSVPQGCENLKWIEECWDWLEQFSEIILFGDNDIPGRRMIAQVVKRLGEARCRIVEEYPAGMDGNELKDANEILCELGSLALLDCVEDAKDIPIRGLINLAKVVPVDPTTIPRIKTNIPALDAAIGGLREGAVTVVTGKAGDGKSIITGQILLNAIEQGYPVCAYSGELTGEEFQNWINLQAAGSDYITLKQDPVKRKMVPTVPKDVEKAIMDWYDGKFFLYNNEEVFESNQSESIVNLFIAAHRKYGCRLFLVDNLLTSVSDSEEETRAQGRFVNVLKRFAKKYSVHVIIVAHARKLAPGKTSIGQDDISGNSAVVKLSHSAFVMERPNIRVIKSRDNGYQGIIECCYCPDSRRVYQKDVGDLNNFSWDKTNVTKPKVRACDDPEYEVQVGASDGGMF